MILLSVLLILPGCRRRSEPNRPGPKGAAASPLTAMDEIARAPAYKPPADGRLTRRQIGMYARGPPARAGAARRGIRRPSTCSSRRDLGYDPREYAWVRDRVLDAEMLRTTRELDRQVAEARQAILARLRKQRETARSAGERDEIDRKTPGAGNPFRIGQRTTRPARRTPIGLLTEVTGHDG